MLFQEIGRDRSAAGLVFLAHEGTDVVADLHPARFERLTDGVGLQVAVFLGERLEDLALHFLARMLSKGLHRVECDCLRASRRANVGMNETVAQAAFHGSDCGAEGPGDGLGGLAIDLHHPREGLELVNRVHRGLRDVLGERQGRGDVAVVPDETAVHLGFRREPLDGLVRDQLFQRGMAPATGKHGIFAVELLDKERLEQAQYGDAGLQMGDVLGVVGFRGVATHIGWMGSQIADGDGDGFEACGHGMSFSMGMVRSARSRT